METGEFFKKFQKDFADMKQQMPELVNSFSAFFGTVMKEGALTVREKELIALGIGLSKQCEHCIRIHVQKCLSAGATKEQILEAAAVTVMMEGGPAYTHVPMVIETIKALEG